MKQTILGAVSPETAYVVDDYPYGFTLRTKIRYWIESNKRGRRWMSQTLNPKTGAWNKAKGSTYSPLRSMYLDEKGYVQAAAWTPYGGRDELLEYGRQFALDAEQRKEFALLVAFYEMRARKEAA